MFPLNYIWPEHYYEVVQDKPVLITATTTPTALMSGYPYKWVFSYLLKMRSFGTATYVAVGDETAQEWRLTLVGQTFGFNANPKEVFDLTKVYLVSDANTAVVEMIAAFMPLPMQGDVIESKMRF